MKYFLIIFFTLFSFNIFAQPFPVPEDNEVTFDVVRKNKNIGTLNDLKDINRFVYGYK